MKPPKGPNDLASADALLVAWGDLPDAERQFAFEHLTSDEQVRLFAKLSLASQLSLSNAIPREFFPALLSGLNLRSLTDFLLACSPLDREQFLEHLLLPHDQLREVRYLLNCAENTRLGVRKFRFARLSADMSANEAIAYFRDQANLKLDDIYYAYVLDNDEKLVGVVPFRRLFLSASEKSVRDIMLTDLITLPEGAEPQEIARIFTVHGLLAIPVVDAAGRMQGIVTSEGIVQQLQAEATEDMQKSAGMEALGAPYLSLSVPDMVKKRAGWLLVLFLGETFTATAMGYYEQEIERAVVLALFIPLIISSGGNSGSQASTLIIRAIALHEVKLSDWWRVFLRELVSGLALGGILGGFGILRILLWPSRDAIYGTHFVAIAFTVGFSLVGIVLWGSLAGSMLPFLLRRLGFDPASASAPFVATLVDVTGLIIYFSVAKLILGGVLL